MQIRLVCKKFGPVDVLRGAKAHCIPIDLPMAMNSVVSSYPRHSKGKDTGP